MTNTPNPIDRRALSRGLIAGAVLAVFALILFFVLWSALSGIEQVARLFIALCVPPGIVGVIVGVYALFFRRPQV
jgi:hypothetical protein